MARTLIPLFLLFVGACGPAASYEPADLAARFEVLRPALEAVLGEEFGEAPEFAVGTEDELVRIISRENNWFQANVAGGPRGITLSLQSSQVAKAIAPALLAKLDIETGRVVFHPAAFDFLADLAPEYRAIRGEAFRDFIVLHEAVHVWQHRRYGMSKFIGQPTSVEEILCRQAVIEGHAQHVAGKAAEAVGLAEEYRRLERLNSEVPESIEDPGVRMVVQAMNSFAAFQYVEGRRFVDAVVAELGTEEGVARVFAEPPKMARHVARPAEYLAGGVAGEELREIATEVRELLSGSRSGGNLMTMTKEMLRQNLATLGDGGPKDALAGYVDGVIVVTTTGFPPMPEYIVAMIEFETADQATAFLEVEKTVDQAKNEAFSEAGGMLRIRDAEARDLDWKGRKVFYSSKRVKLPDGQEIRMRNLVMPSGKLIVEFSAQGEDHTPVELRELAEKILSILEPGK